VGQLGLWRLALRVRDIATCSRRSFLFHTLSLLHIPIRWSVNAQLLLVALLQLHFKPVGRLWVLDRVDAIARTHKCSIVRARTFVFDYFRLNGIARLLLFSFRAAYLLEIDRDIPLGVDCLCTFYILLRLLVIDLGEVKSAHLALFQRKHLEDHLPAVLLSKRFLSGDFLASKVLLLGLVAGYAPFTSDYGVLALN